MTTLDWDMARRRHLGPSGKPTPVKADSRPPTGKQLRYIAHLAREANVPVPEVRNREQMTQAIQKLKYLAARSA